MKMREWEGVGPSLLMEPAVCTARRARHRAEFRTRARVQGMVFFSSSVPLRCPETLIAEPLARLDGGIDSETAKEWLRNGRAFVTRDRALIGQRLQCWDFEHLARHLPLDKRFGVYVVKERLVMSHSLRYSKLKLAPDGSVIGAPPVDKCGDRGMFAHSAVRYLTFREFADASAECEHDQHAVGRPYLGIDIFKRANKQDVKGSFGPLGTQLLDELSTFAWPRLEAMERRGELPILSSFHLFAGSSHILYHLHYDHNPNLHVQLVGRKRFILFAPSDWPYLYPFPVHADFDRRSQLNLDAPDTAAFPKWERARGLIVELEPGDVLYIPPLWWHHVQTLTSPCVSAALWFFDVHPTPRDYMPSSGAALALSAAIGRTERCPPTVANRFAGHFFGLCSGGAELSLTRWVEQVIGQQVATPDLPPAAMCESDTGEAYEGRAKEKAVSFWMRQAAQHARGEMLAPSELATMPALRCGALSQLMGELYVQLASDLGCSMPEARAWVVKLVEGRFAPLPPSELSSSD